MRKTSLLLIIALFMGFSAQAQKSKNKVEVLYFKANLACCKAKACSALQSEIQGFVQSNYPDGNVVFVEVKIADEANKDVVAKYNAQSQTVIIRKQKKKKETVENVTAIVQQYMKDQNKEVMEKALKTKIDAFL